VAGIKQRLIDDLLREASPQTSVPDFKIRSDIADDVGPRIDAAIDSKAGGMANFRRMLGLGIAGAISGTIHDSDGAAGVEVASDDHPEPWLAYGDGKLKRSPTSFEHDPGGGDRRGARSVLDRTAVQVGLEVHPAPDAGAQARH
jgi:hypothetical protein